MNDDLGDRMKESYELPEAGRRIMPRLPILARLDGRSFSSFTRGLARPFDARLSDLMVDLTTLLVKETGAICGYTQSDEISLAFIAPDAKSQIFFDGKIQKMVSVLAAVASVEFNRLLPNRIPEKVPPPEKSGPVFDCRVWGVPSLDEAANVFLWRELDSTKNSVSMAAREFFSHKELFEKTGSQMQEMMFTQHGVNWGRDYPDFFRRGSYVLRRTVTRKLSPEDLVDLPPLHDARKNPDLEITRSVVTRVSMPPLTRVSNRVGVLFGGEDPVTVQEEPCPTNPPPTPASAPATS